MATAAVVGVVAAGVAVALVAVALVAVAFYKILLVVTAAAVPTF